jgi:hypothetical protein
MDTVKKQITRSAFDVFIFLFLFLGFILMDSLTCHSVRGKYWDNYHKIGAGMYQRRSNNAAGQVHYISANHTKDKSYP